MSIQNPAEVLGLTTLNYDAPLARILRACGIDEVCITGGASDCDKFFALAQALTMCDGHALRPSICQTLADATGLPLPLCPHTARAHWMNWIRRQANENTAPTSTVPASCPVCRESRMTKLPSDRLFNLSDPVAMIASSDTYETWSNAWKNAIQGAPIHQVLAVSISDAYTYLRPDPYHVALAVKAVAARKTTDTNDKPADAAALIWTQALRLAGEVACADGRTLLLHGGTSTAVASLLAYLYTEERLPDLVWIPTDPTAVAAVSGLYSTVRTGMRDACAADPTTLAAYAAIAPLGRAVCLV